MCFSSANTTSRSHEEAAFCGNDGGKDIIKVMYVLNTASVTTRRFFLPLARRVEERGYKVIIATGPGDKENEFHDTGFPIHIVPIRRRLFTSAHLRAFWQLYRLIRYERPQIVHTHTPVASALARAAAALAGTPIILYHLRGSYIGQQPVAEKLFLVFERLFAPLNSFVFTLNRFDAQDFTSHGIARRERLLNLSSGGSGVDVETMEPESVDSAQRERLRRELGLQEGPVLGFIGRMVEEKGILDLLNAFRVVSAAYPEVQLLMVGDVLKSGRDKQSFVTFKEKVRSSGLEQRVVCTGFRDDVPILLTLMDVLVLPSHRETFGMTIAEAAAMGVPAVTTATRGGREAVVENKTGLVVPLRDPEAMAQALIWLLRNPDQRRLMGQKARKRAENVFSERRVVDRQIEVYEKLLREHGFHSPIAQS